ncbi:hypothetical protein [Bradyrhizobium sp. CCBAU 11386]|uniref:hypothetical protein n=1 Tax=Bradyrhizobium sp. CCBAU 11386 TaxID=1630837 RepID=UPI0023043D78|nr:hypothetical protein [Bradyrhizobium sp. CCBAU 11386]
MKRWMGQGKAFITGQAKSIKHDALRTRAGVLALSASANVAITSENVATMRSVNKARISNLQSRECARGDVTRVRSASRVVDIGIAENSCFKGFPARSDQSSLMKRGPLERTVASGLQQFRRSLL